MNRQKKSSKTDTLCTRVRDFIAHNPKSLQNIPGDDIQRLMEELKTHQIELELENEELRKTLLDLEAAREKYFSQFDLAPVAYFTLVENGIIIESNLTGSRMLGTVRQKLIGSAMVNYIAAEYQAKFRNHLKIALESDSGQTDEIQLQKDGIAGAFVQMDSRIFLDTKNKSRQIHCTMVDITDFKQIENTIMFLLQHSWLTEREDIFQSLARYLTENLEMDYICIDRLEENQLTAKTVAVYYDGVFEDNVEYSLEDTPCGAVVEKGVCIFPSGVQKLFPKDIVLQKMMAESYIGSILKSSDGKPIGLIAMIRRKPLENTRLVETILNIVSNSLANELERQQSEDVLKKSEEKFKMLVEGSPDIMYIYSNKRGALYWSSRVKDILGFGPDELMENPFLWNEAIHPDDQASVSIVIEDKEKKQGTTIEYRIQDKEGVWHWLQDRFINKHISDDEIIIEGLATDITEHKTKDEILRRKAQVDAALAALYKPIISPTSTIQIVAKSILEQALQLSGSKFGFVGTIDPDSGDLISHTISEMMKTGQCQISAKENKKIIFPIGKDGRYPNLWGHALNTGNAFYTNNATNHPSYHGTPEGHIILERFLAVPVMLGSKPIGQIALANSERDYSDDCLEVIKRIADYFALAIQRQQVEAQVIEKTKNLELFNESMIDREMRIIELKKEINLLCQDLHIPDKYPMVWDGATEDANSPGEDA